MPAIALGVLIVTSIAGTPPSSSALAMSGRTSLDGARMTATTPASAMRDMFCSLVAMVLWFYSRISRRASPPANRWGVESSFVLTTLPRHACELIKSKDDQRLPRRPEVHGADALQCVPEGWEVLRRPRPARDA